MTTQQNTGQATKNYWSLDMGVGDAIRHTKFVPTERMVGNLEALFQKSGFTTRVRSDEGITIVVGVDLHSMVRVEVAEQRANYKRFNGRVYDLEEEANQSNATD